MDGWQTRGTERAAALTATVAGGRPDALARDSPPDRYIKRAYNRSHEGANMKELLMSLDEAVGIALACFAGRYSGRLPHANAEARSSDVSPEPWQIRFQIPASVRIPTGDPLVKCDIPR